MSSENIQGSLVSLQDLPVSDSELVEIEDHLVKLYVGYLNDLFSKGVKVKGEFESFVMKPLYVAALEYCKGNKGGAGNILGIVRAALDDKLYRYFATKNVSGLWLVGAEKRLFMLYSSYLEQILVDEINKKFFTVVQRAMYRSVMEFGKDDLGMGSILLGVSWGTMAANLDKFFGTRQLYELSQTKEVI